MRLYRIRKFPAKLFLLILIVAATLLNPRIFLALKSFTFEILTKPLSIFSSAKEYFNRVAELSEQNLLLKQRLAALSVELARTEDAIRENERLRELLDFKKSGSYRTIVARVISRDSMDWHSSVVINRGKKHGIREHSSCATAKGLVGSVVEVGPTSSKVMLITDPNSRVGVILEHSRESGVLIGSPQRTCKVIYLSLDANIDKNDKVLTAGFSAFLPKGLAIGRVTEVGIEMANLYKYAIVDPFEDMGRVEEVICILTE